MRFVLFYHSLKSDWNNGNSHFSRGVATELVSRGHDVQAYEPLDGWSLTNLTAGHGDEPVAEFHQHYPAIRSDFYDEGDLDLDEMLDGADAVIVHEWNSPELIAKIGVHRGLRGKYRLLFHDTHHRAVSDSAWRSCVDAADYDGILVFGASLAETYKKNGWHRDVWVWHEAADTRIFYPRSTSTRTADVVWIGNWGDGERSDELYDYVIKPVCDSELKGTAYGVRYPASAVKTLAENGWTYRGWIPNYHVPEIFSQHLATVHVPRRYYKDELHGIPTIRVFEAMACGIPLICSPWCDSEGLFSPGKDYLVAKGNEEMPELLSEVCSHESLRNDLITHGLRTIAEKHTCAHRVDELLRILQ